jgi:hypothetical protein
LRQAWVKVGPLRYTALSFVIADTATSGSDTSNSISFVAGDLISISVVPSGTPTAFGIHYWDIECNANGQTIIGGNGNTPSNSVANYSVAQGGSSVPWTATETDVQIVCPTAGTLSNLYAKLAGTPSSGTNYALTLQKNGADSALTTTIADLTTAGNDTTNSVTVAAGDTLSMKLAPTNTPTARAAWWGIQFTPTTDGESFFGFGNASLPATASTNYEQGFYGGVANANWNASEPTGTGYIGPQTLKNMYIKLITAPGGAASRAFTVRNNSVDTALTTTISTSGTTGNSTNDVAFARGEVFTLKCVPTSTPAVATGGVHAGYLIYNTPTASTRRVIIVS